MDIESSSGTDESIQDIIGADKFLIPEQNFDSRKYGI